MPKTEIKEEVHDIEAMDEIEESSSESSSESFSLEKPKR